MILTNLYDDSEYIKNAYEQLMSVARGVAMTTPLYTGLRNTTSHKKRNNYLNHRKYIGDFNNYSANAWKNNINLIIMLYLKNLDCYYS